MSRRDRPAKPTPEQQAEIEAAKQRAQAQAAEDLRQVASTAAGRRFLARTIAGCHVFDEVMTGNSWTYHKAGRRAVGLELMRAMAEHTPDAYIQIHRDALARTPEP
jgi:hypothetical protein